MFNQLQNQLQKFFGISRTETNGIILLILLLLFLVISPLIYRQYGKGGYKNYNQDLFLLDSISRILALADERIITEEKKEHGTAKSISFFDPNEVSFSQMIEMGFDSIVARRIIRYRNKGGKFYKNKDLLKIYDLSTEFYNQISSYIKLPEQTVKIPDQAPVEDRITVTPGFEERADIRLDLNRVDTADLLRIKGIGPVFSKRILKYRNLLGGYIDTGQLGEVYGLDGEALLTVTRLAYVDSLFSPVKIRINFSEWQDLVKHPYFPSDMATRIVTIRSTGGPYLNADDFKIRLNLTDSLMNRLVSYIEF